MTAEHFDAVVIGSGFGGSVMAYRLAEKGLRVCVLERGKAHAPGQFPRAPHLVKENFWDPSAGLYGMYNVWFFRRLGALVSSGLGGGSLIYANVLKRKDEKWFVTEDLASGGYEHWPVTRKDLDPHYDEVERIMTPQEYPFDKPPYDDVVKVRAFRAAVQRLEAEGRGKAIALPLAVTFHNPGEEPRPGDVIRGVPENVHGFERRTCVLCGECVVGCNYGAKNTLDLTYLSRAELAGAELRTECEVRAFRPRSRGYEVTYVKHNVRNKQPHDTQQLERTTITCDRLILAAGAFGSTYLLLRNLDEFPGVSRAQLGTRFSGNGDLLAFAISCMQREGDRMVPWRLDPTRGPTITSALHRTDRVDGSDGRGFYIEDAGFPSQIAWLIEGLNTPGWYLRAKSFVKGMLRRMFDHDSDSDLSSELSDLLGPASLSSCSLPLLAMGRDVPDGKFFLDNGRLALDWSRDRSGDYFDQVTDAARAIASELGGKFVLNPSAMLFQRAVTVHPLGGCPMGRDADSGVVSSYGEVFGHPGFFIVDGSALPGSVGPNPALTIAAVADRAATKLLEDWPRT